jgi:hypothetical protein
VLRLAEISESDCNKALCCAKLEEGGSGEVHTNILSYVELDLCLYACNNIVRR